MKKLIFLVFVLLIIVQNTNCQELYETSEVSDNLYVIENPEGGNIAFLITRKGIVVIDAGANPNNADRIIETIKSISDKPIKYLILTHLHGDHVYGLSSFPKDIKVIAHNYLESNYIKFNQSRIKSYTDSILPNYLKNVQQELESMNDLNSEEYISLKETYDLNKNYLENIKRIEFRKPDITFDDYYMLKLGGERIMLEYTGPCHTNDNIVVKFSNHNVIHTGDLVFSKEFPYTINEHGVDIYNWIKTLDDLFKENIVTVIPGHGASDNKYALKDQADYFKQLAQKIERLKNDGFSLSEIIERFKPEDYDLKGNEDQLPVNITVVYNQLINSEVKWWEF